MAAQVNLDTFVRDPPTQGKNRTSVQTVDSGYGGSIHPGKRGSSATTKTRQSTLPPGARDSAYSATSAPYSPDEEIPPVPKLYESVIPETDTAASDSDVRPSSKFSTLNPYYQHGLAEARAQPESTQVLERSRPSGPGAVAVQEQDTARPEPSDVQIIPLEPVNEPAPIWNVVPSNEPRLPKPSPAPSKIKGTQDWKGFYIYRPTDHLSYGKVVKAANKSDVLYHSSYSIKGASGWESLLKLGSEHGKTVGEVSQASKSDPIQLKLWHNGKRQQWQLGKDGVLKQTHSNVAPVYKWEMSGFGTIKCFDLESGQVAAIYRPVAATQKYGEIRLEKTHENDQDQIIAGTLARIDQKGGKQLRGANKAARLAVNLAWWLRGFAGASEGHL